MLDHGLDMLDDHDGKLLQDGVHTNPDVMGACFSFLVRLINING
jgi:hypothetical protein